MSVTVSQPTLWSARILEYLDKVLVYKTALTNNNYEGEAKEGGTVKAFYVSDVSTSAYAGGWDDSDWAELTDNAVTITIDQKTKFLFKVTRVDSEFSAINLIDQGSQRAAQAVGDTVDQYIAGLHTQVAAGNAYGTDDDPIAVGLGNGETKPSLALARLMEKLVDAKAPTGDCRVVIPSWMGTMLLTELGVNRATALGDKLAGASVKPGLLINDIAGFREIHVSPNVPTDTNGADETVYKVLAGSPMITFASAIAEVNTLELQNDFATGVKGLYVYGAKLPRGQYMALGTFTKGSYS